MMKKFFITLIVFLAIATTSFAQFTDIYGNSNIQDVISPSISNNMNSLTTGIGNNSLGITNNHHISVSGYTRRNGTCVSEYTRTSPNKTNIDNFSTKGNSNPYNGISGSRARDYSSDAYNYGAGKTVYEGPKGGIYVYGRNGNKTYLPKR